MSLMRSMQVYQSSTILALLTVLGCRSMRYEVAQLARRHRAAFAVIYLPCPLVLSAFAARILALHHPGCSLGSWL